MESAKGSQIGASSYLRGVKGYYDTSTRWYEWFYYDKNSLGLHYGFWETPQDTLEVALTNQYRVIQKLLDPASGDLILDAGCGVGGGIDLARGTYGSNLCRHHII